VSDDLCVICRDRPAHGAYACIECTEKARQQLAEIAELVEPARAIAYRQTSGDGTGGGCVPGSRVPIDLAAGARLDTVQVALTGWARELAEARNVGAVPDGRDVIVLAAAYIAQCLEIARHKEWVDEMLREISDCLATMRYVTDRRRERIYLGMCRAVLLVEGVEGPHACEGSVYGSVGASRATCKACGARYDQEARIAERNELAHARTYTAAEIAAAYPGVVLASTIRQWRRRGLLTVHGEVDGHRLYQVSEVLALAESTKERQAGRRETAEMGAWL
jgi:hypothetical protein